MGSYVAVSASAMRFGRALERATLVSSGESFGGDGADSERRNDGSGGCKRSGKNSLLNERAGCQQMQICSEGGGGDAGRASATEFRARSAHLRMRSGLEKLRLAGGAPEVLPWGGGASRLPTRAMLSHIGDISSTKAGELGSDVGRRGEKRRGAAGSTSGRRGDKCRGAAGSTSRMLEDLVKIGGARRLCREPASTRGSTSRGSEPLRFVSRREGMLRTSSRCPRGSICIRS